MSTPFLSIIIPTRNEVLYIDNCLKSILSDGYNKDYLEVLIVDGMSSDTTREIVNSYVSDYSFIKIIDNPRNIFPCAVNIGLKESKGDVILILGAHATYPVDYISNCVKYLFELNADNVGGALKTVGLDNSYIGRAITSVLSSPFGVGNSTFRTGSDKIVEVDTVFGGCYHRRVFVKIGFFNENLVSSSDMDFNTRLKRSGGRIYLVPEIIVIYYTRSSFSKFMKNNFRNGFWAIYPMRFLDYVPVSLRHFIPLLFFTGILVGIALSFISAIFLYILLGTLSLYFIVSILISLKFFNKKDYSFLILPFFFPLLHITYGLGSLIAFVRVLFAKLF